LRLFFCFNVPPSLAPQNAGLRLACFCAVAGGVWGGKRPHIWGENTKISAKRKTSKNGRRVGEEGSFCSEKKSKEIGEKRDLF